MNQTPGCRAGLRTEYVLDVATPLTMVLGETTDPSGPEEASLYYLHGLDLIAQGDGMETTYFNYDGLGTVRQMFTSADSLLRPHSFDPYGNLMYPVPLSSFGLGGEQVDANGLLYLRARYYSPEMGRFLNMDPSRQEVNPYQYGNSNPIMQIDPSGLESRCWPNQTNTEVCQTVAPISTPYSASSSIYDPNGYYYYTTGGFIKEYLDFEPTTELSTIPGLHHQYDIIEHYARQHRLDLAGVQEQLGLYSWNCDYNSCGPLSVATILYNLLGDSVDPALILQQFGCREEHTTATVTIRDLINEYYGDELTATRLFPRETPEQGGARAEITLSSESYFSWIREKLQTPTEWPVVLGRVLKVCLLRSKHETTRTNKQAMETYQAAAAAAATGNGKAERGPSQDHQWHPLDIKDRCAVA